jgi:hypothetical protein
MRTKQSKKFISIILIAFSAFITIPTFAQNRNDSSALDYSHPGKYHQILAELAGEWTFNTRRFSGNPNPDSNKVVNEFSGNFVRKSFANGRFFIVELTGGKLQIPIQDGKMKEENVQDIEIEGYDNVKRKFVFTFINNHIGSGIIYSEGSYDSTTKTISYEYEVEPVPGRKLRFRKILILDNNDHYKVEYYNERNGTMVKINERSCTRVKEK